MTSLTAASKLWITGRFVGLDGTSSPAYLMQRNIESELKRTRGIQLFNKNIALR
jgi:hypothetical protein